jgi:hypothetical protein
MPQIDPIDDYIEPQLIIQAKAHEIEELTRKGDGRDEMYKRDLDYDIKMLAANIVNNYVQTCIANGKGLTPAEFLRLADGGEEMVRFLMDSAAEKEREECRAIAEDEMNLRMDEEAIGGCFRIMEKISERSK